ncbi:MAG TPA: hypothetical protein VEJ46_00285 [Candidatus Acidoferrum sp.]|nr:hypothetical protein [Candidatus Acidoferrum sp.]
MTLKHPDDLGCSRRPRLRAFAAAVIIALPILASVAPPEFASQDNKQANERQPDLKAFVGTWKATYKGDVFAILILKEQAGKLSGTLNNFDISVDKDGNLADGTHKDDGDAPLLNIHFKSGELYFIVLEKDQYRPGMNWKFVPLDAGEGELAPVLDHQEDVPKDTLIKPIRMVREHSKP